MPVITLTALAIRHLKPEAGKQVTYLDKSLKGFGVRVGAKSMTYILIYGPDRTRVKLGEVGIVKLVDARQKARTILAERQLGVHQPKGQEHGLERIFIEFGVAPKRGGDARLAFERSARQAGFFEHGDDRLVAPLVVTTSADGERREDASRSPQIVQAVGSARGLSHAAAHSTAAAQRHKLIDGLFQELPEPQAQWGTAERVRWLRLAASMFDVLYDRPDTLVAIEIKTVVEGSDGETG